MMKVRTIEDRGIKQREREDEGGIKEVEKKRDREKTSETNA